MKRRATTLVRRYRKSILGKSLIAASILVLAVATPVQLAQHVSADKYDDQIQALQQDIDNANSQVAQLKTQAEMYESAVAQ